MKAYFDRDGRKSNTIDIPQTEGNICPKNGMDFCIDAKCTDCETRKLPVEYRTIQFLVPVHEVTIDTGQYAKWSEWDITPKDKMLIDPSHEYSVPKSFIEGLKMIMSMVQDVIVKCEKGGD